MTAKKPVDIYEVLHDFKLDNQDKIEEQFVKLRSLDVSRLLTEMMVHYDIRKESILNELKNRHSFAVFPEGGKVFVPSYVGDGKNFYKVQATFDESFVSAICLYADKLVIIDPIYQALWRILTQGTAEAYEDLHSALYIVGVGRIQLHKSDKQNGVSNR